jgi:DNA-binding transcriptional ArsR family regulator
MAYFVYYETMQAEPNIAAVGALVGVPSRAAMLLALASGEALPASELAYRARLSPQTASSHLAKLVEGGLLRVERCGRHRYYCMANAEVSQIIEGMMALAQPVALRSRPDRDRLKELCAGRSCYNHLAGELGVAIATALVSRRLIRLKEKDYEVTRAGRRWFADFGIDIGDLKRQRRLFARRCIDWSERKPHIGGALGDALTTQLFARKWIRRGKKARSVHLTERGRRELKGFCRSTWNAASDVPGR